MSADMKVGRVPIDSIDFHRHNVRVDLGDLRDLVESIKRFGVMQPVVLEQRGTRLRIRAGHRRVAASRLAGLDRIPAIIHGVSLEDDEWLTAAVHENTRRRGLDADDRNRSAAAMRAAGMTWEAIADAFGVNVSTARGYVAASERGRSSGEETRDERNETITELTRQGVSAADIANRLHVTPRTVVRVRTHWRSISARRIRALVDEARAGEWTTSDVLAALDEIAGVPS